MSRHLFQDHLSDQECVVAGLHRWLSGKESACNAGDAVDMGLIPGLGRSPGGGNGNPLQYFCLENPMDRGSGGLQSITGWQILRHDLVTNTHAPQWIRNNMGSGIRYTYSIIQKILFECPSAWHYSRHWEYSSDPAFRSLPVS